jgi:hypothetical protein
MEISLLALGNNNRPSQGLDVKGENVNLVEHLQEYPALFHFKF